jgi:hypothetical protein
VIRVVEELVVLLLLLRRVLIGLREIDRRLVVRLVG